MVNEKDEEFVKHLNMMFDAAARNRGAIEDDVVDGIAYYNRERPKQYYKDQSNWTDGSVRDQLQSAVAQLRDIFTSTDSVVRVNVQNSHAMPFINNVITDHINNVLLNDNEGFDLITSVLFESLLTCAGVTKTYWQENKKVTRQTFEGISEDAVMVLMQQVDNVEIEKQEDDGTYTGYCEIVEDKSGLVTEFVPFENFYMDARASSINKTKYCAEAITKTVAEWEELGVTIEEDDDFEVSINKDRIDAIRSTREDWSKEDRSDQAKELGINDVTLVEHYVRMKRNGVYGCWRVLGSRNRVIQAEPVEKPPYSAFRPLPLPNVYYGESFPDILKDIQDAQSIIMRGTFDNIRDAVDPSIIAVKDAYNPRTLLNRRKGRVIEVEDPAAISPFKERMFDSAAVATAQAYIQQQRDERTGISALTMGMDANVFKNDNAYATVQTAMTAAMQRMKYIGLNLAQGGFKNLFALIYDILRENDTNTYTVNVEGQELQYSPSQWPEYYEVKVEGELSNAERENRGVKIMNLYGMLNQDEELKTLQLFTPQNKLMMLRDYCRAAKLDVNYIQPLTAMQVPQPDPIEERLKEAQVGIAEGERMVKESAAMLNVSKAGELKGRFELEQLNSADKMRLDFRKQDFEERRAGVQDAQKTDDLMRKRDESSAEMILELLQQRPVAIGNGKV